MESDFVVYMIGVIFVEFFGIFFWFDIMGGNYDSYFDVDKGIGIIIVVKFFDVEQKLNYNFIVEVIDGIIIIFIQVFIKVIDINDYCFQFFILKYEVVIFEDMVLEIEIVCVSVVDQDGKNRLIYIL